MGAGRGLLVVGDVVTDVLALHGVPLQAGTDTPAHIAVRPGGSAANTAAWAAWLDPGSKVRLLARVGTDSGDWHREHLRDAGVRPCLRVDPVHPTAVIIVMVDGTGERTMLTNRGAGGWLAPADWDDALLEGVAGLHLSGYTLFTEAGRGLAELALRRARLRGVRISVDPASAGFLTSFGPGRFLAATGGADVVLPNRDEAALLTGEDDPEAAAVRLSAHYGLVVLKLGADGALAARDAHIVMRAHAHAAEAVDSTGAGDAFAAGFLTTLAIETAGPYAPARNAELKQASGEQVRDAALRDTALGQAEGEQVAGGAHRQSAGHSGLSDAAIAAAVVAGCRAGALAVAQVGGRPADRELPLTSS